MGRSLTLLDRVQVKSPCTEDWNEMVGNDQVRFCSHCSKHVHNLSAMTRREAEALALKSNGNLCIRYRRNPVDQTVVTLPVRLGNMLTRRLSLPIAAGVMAVALNTAPALGQESQPLSNQIVTVNDDNGSGSRAVTSQSGGSTVTGIVKDQSGAVIAGASIKLVNTITGEERTLTTDDQGDYRCDNLSEGIYMIGVEVPGFLPRVVDGIGVQQGRTVAIPPIELDVNGQELDIAGGISAPSAIELWVYHNEERTEPVTLDPTAQEFWDTFSPGSDLEEAKGLFVDQGYSPNIQNGFGETPLMESFRNPEMVELLLVCGANANARSVFGVTPLMFAMLGEDVKVPKMLIQAGADVNAADKDGRTALMLAAFDGQTKFMKLLIASGANVNATDKFGKNVYEYAFESGQKAPLNLMKKAGAKPSTQSKPAPKKETCTTR